MITLVKFTFYFNFRKRFFNAVLIFIISSSQVFSQKNEFKVTYYTPHIEQIKESGFLKSAEIRNHNMSLNYYHELFKISDNSYFGLLAGFEYAWFKINTTYKDNIGSEISEKFTDNYGLKGGINLKYKVFDEQKYSIYFVPSYSILARFPIISYGSLGLIKADSTFYVFGYEVDDTGKSIFNHSIDLSFLYNRKINNSTSINFGIDLLIYLKTYRRIKYYTESSYQPLLTNSVAYLYKQIGFSVGLSF